MNYKCPKCGNLIEEGVNPCPTCGQVFNWPKKDPKPIAPPVAPVVQPKTPIEQATYQQPVANEDPISQTFPNIQSTDPGSDTEPNKPNNKKKIIIICCIILLLVIAIIFAIIKIANNDTSKDPLPNEESTVTTTIESTTEEQTEETTTEATTVATTQATTAYVTPLFTTTQKATTTKAAEPEATIVLEDSYPLTLTNSRGVHGEITSLSITDTVYLGNNKFVTNFTYTKTSTENFVRFKIIMKDSDGVIVGDCSDSISSDVGSVTKEQDGIVYSVSGNGTYYLSVVAYG